MEYRCKYCGLKRASRQSKIAHETSCPTKTAMLADTDAVQKLLLYPSWRLERISIKTFPHDISSKMNYLTESEVDGLIALIKKGICFRCRLGSERHYFGASIKEAVDNAINNYNKKFNSERTKENAKTKEKG